LYCIIPDKTYIFVSTIRRSDIQPEDKSIIKITIKTHTVMKAITFAAVLCLLSSSAFSIGRPHNVFATRKAMQEASQSKKEVVPQRSILKEVTQQAQNGAEGTRQAVSTVTKIVRFLTSLAD
jgi:hypothetical protein